MKSVIRSGGGLEGERWKDGEKDEEEEDRGGCLRLGRRRAGEM